MSARNYPGLVEWRLNGERGISSEAIADQLQYGRVSARWGNRNWPRDPSDFRRCEVLLRQTLGMREDLPLMCDVHPVWAELLKVWSEIVDAMEQEAPGCFDSRARGNCPRAYDMIRAAIERGDA